MKKPMYRGLFFQVIVAIILGVALGFFYPPLAISMKPLGDAFINLIKMLIAPIIFCTIVTGVAGMSSMKEVGRVGVKALICFEVTTTIALVIGMVLVEFWQPGAHMQITAASTGADVGAIKEKVQHTELASASDFILHIIPTTIVSAFSSGDTLQVLLVALLFAAALPTLGEKRKPVLNAVEIVSRILFRMMDNITLLAPIGAFGAIAFAVGKYGLASLTNLGELLGIFYLTCILFVFLVLGPFLRFYCQLSTFKFLAYLKEELLIVLGTSSSESVLPRLMEKLEKMGVSRPIVGMVVPAGYSFNLVGSSIYFTMGAMFIIFATHTQISFWQEMTLLGVLLIASKGAAGVAGSGFIILAATLTTMKIMPQAELDVGLALIYGVDRFMSMGRAITNLIGNGMTALIVAKWEGELDIPATQRALEKGSNI